MPIDIVEQPANPTVPAQLMQLYQQISTMSYIMDCISKCLGDYLIPGTPLPGSDKMGILLDFQKQLNDHIMNLMAAEEAFRLQMDTLSDAHLNRTVSKELTDELDKLLAARSNDPKDFLVVEDKEKPTTWHLQVKRNGVPDHNLMGAAWAALHSGFRGNKYEGPKKRDALAKLKALYKKEKLPLPSEK